VFGVGNGVLVCHACSAGGGYREERVGGGDPTWLKTWGGGVWAERSATSGQGKGGNRVSKTTKVWDQGFGGVSQTEGNKMPWGEKGKRPTKLTAPKAGNSYVKPEGQNVSNFIYRGSMELGKKIAFPVSSPEPCGSYRERRYQAKRYKEVDVERKRGERTSPKNL